MDWVQLYLPVMKLRVAWFCFRSSVTADLLVHSNKLVSVHISASTAYPSKHRGVKQRISVAVRGYAIARRLTSLMERLCGWTWKARRGKRPAPAR